MFFMILMCWCKKLKKYYFNFFKKYHIPPHYRQTLIQQKLKWRIGAFLFVKNCDSYTYIYYIWWKSQCTWKRKEKKEREEIKKIIFEKERVYIYILLIIFDELIWHYLSHFYIFSFIQYLLTVNNWLSYNFSNNSDMQILV